MSVRSNGVSKPAPDQVRHLDEKRPRVAAEARHELASKRMKTLVVQVVVVPGVKSRSGTRRPAKQCLRSQAGVERVVVEDQTRERRFGELVRAAQRHDVDL